MTIETIEVVIEKNRDAKKYRLVEDANKPAGLAPQAQCVFYAMKMVGNFATVEEIAKELRGIAQFKTRQPATRIVQYYLPTLNKHGVIEKS